MLDAIYNLLNRAMSLHNDFAVEAMDKPETLEKVVFLNTEEQMYNKGINADGERMGFYEPYTINEKIANGQRYDHITGENTGEMYKSARAEFDYEGNLNMSMDTIKDGKDISVVTDWGKNWGKNIVGLTDESMARLKPINRDNIIKDLRKFL